MFKTAKSICNFKMMWSWNKYNTYFFSNSVQYYKAVLASDIIRLIRAQQSTINSEPVKIQNAKTLRQLIVDHIIEKKFQTQQSGMSNQNCEDVKEKKNMQLLSEQARKQILSIFTDGVWISERVLGVNRFLFNKFETKQLNSQYKIPFIPTYIITTKIFRQIQSISNTLITGQYGTGKSFSCLLYKVLSDVIFKYRSLEIATQKEQNKNSQIQYNIPKIIYWSGKLKEVKEDIQRRLISQCDELSKSQKEIILKRSQSSSYIFYGTNLQAQYRKTFKDDKIMLLLIRDQIDYTARVLRQTNTKIDKKTNQKIKYLEELNQITTDFLVSFRAILYLSSIHIQLSLLNKLKLIKEQNHRQMGIKRLQYYQNIDKFYNKLDIIEFIIYNLERNQNFCKHFEKKQLVQKETFIKDLKTNLLIIFIKSNQKFITPHLINTTLKNQKFQIKFNDNDKMQQAKEFLKKVIEKCLSQFSDKIGLFMKKQIIPIVSTQFKTSFILKMLNKAYQLENENSKDNSVKINLDFGWVKRLAGATSLQDVQNFLLDHIDKHIFKLDQYKLQNDNQIQIQLLIPKQSFRYLMSKNEDQLFKSLERIQKPLIDIISTNRSVFGVMIETILKKILISYKFQMQWKKIGNIPNNTNALIQQQFQSRIWRNSQQIGFKQLPKINQSNFYNYRFLDQFQYPTNYFQKLDQQRKKKEIRQQPVSYYFSAINNNSLSSQILNNKIDILDSQHHNHYSKIIDFLTIQYDRGFKMNLYDVTVKDDLISKIKSFLFSYANFSQTQLTQLQCNGISKPIQINFILLCPQQKVFQWEQIWKKMISKCSEQILDLEKQKVKQQQQSYLKKSKNQNRKNKKKIIENSKIERIQRQININKKVIQFLQNHYVQDCKAFVIVKNKKSGKQGLLSKICTVSYVNEMVLQSQVSSSCPDPIMAKYFLKLWKQYVQMTKKNESK